MSPTVFIDGAAGTTGLEIEARLSGRQDFTLIKLEEAQRKDSRARRDALNAADFVILCLPDDAAREAVALIDNPSTRVIDASTAHRTTAGWTYGFPELNRTVSGATRISNPGCFSTGFIALVAPLVKSGLIASNAQLICNAVSGYSGGGKAMIAEFESANPPAWRTYALSLAHKHVPEMQIHCGLSQAPLFAPSVANTYRGMIIDVALFGIEADAARRALSDVYAGSPVVAVKVFDQTALTIEHAAGTDRLDLFVFTNGPQTRLVAALDNLGKGASGAAVQTLNLMAGIDQTVGLRL
jgi:N-acetyl-gamma-glutamyl-phosphate reductase